MQPIRLLRPSPAAADQRISAFVQPRSRAYQRWYSLAIHCQQW